MAEGCEYSTTGPTAGLTPPGGRTPGARDGPTVRFPRPCRVITGQEETREARSGQVARSVLTRMF